MDAIVVSPTTTVFAFSIAKFLMDTTLTTMDIVEETLLIATSLIFLVLWAVKSVTRPA
jgi:hypothetical protein